MTSLTNTSLASAFGLALLVAGAGPAFASADAPVMGPARPLVSAETTGGHGDAAPSFGAPYAIVLGDNPNVRVIASGPRFDVIPLALAGQAGYRG